MGKKIRKKKTKTTEFTPTAGPYFAVGLPYQKNFEQFAEMVQETLNQAHANNLSTEVSSHPQGLLFIMRQKHGLQGALQQLFGDKVKVDVDVVSHLSEETCKVMNNIAQYVDVEHPDLFQGIVEKVVADGYFRSMPMEFLKSMEKELEAEVADHAKRCNSPDCPSPRLNAVVLEQLKKHLALSVS